MSAGTGAAARDLLLRRADPGGDSVTLLSSAHRASPRSVRAPPGPLSPADKIETGF